MRTDQTQHYNTLLRANQHTRKAAFINKEIRRIDIKTEKENRITNNAKQPKKKNEKVDVWLINFNN